MTDTEAALLRAIAAHPREDTPRLIYADYLDELAEPSSIARAEFIRLHIQLAQLRFDSPDREPLLRRIDQLLCEWDFVWQKEMPEGLRALSGYSRGFVYRAAAAAAAIEKASDDPRTLLIAYLELSVDVSASRLREVVKQPLFARLTELKLRDDKPIGWSGAKALAEGEYPQLEQLTLARHRIGDIGLRWLCDSWGFPRLRELDLSNNEITDAGASTLLRSSLIGRVRVDLWGNPISQTMTERVASGHREW
jgi:uncharacterized protein (TIGR02996 family)